MAGPRFPRKAAAENKLGWAATLCQQAASTDQAWHGPFPYPSKDFPPLHIFSDLNGDILSVYILEHPSAQMKPIELSSSLRNKQGILFSLYEVIFIHTSGFKISVSVKILACGPAAEPSGKYLGAVKEGAAAQGAGTVWGTGFLRVL